MRHLYTLFLTGFTLIVPLFLWIDPKFAKWWRARGQWKGDLSMFRRDSSKKLIWFHCASVGEFEQARPVIEQLPSEQFQIAVTFFSPSGYEARKDYTRADIVTYLPTDLPKHAVKLLDLMKPDAAVFVKYELWFNFLHELNRRQIPMTLISAHFPHKHWSTQWPGIHLGKQLADFDRIFAQTDVTCSRLQSVGIENCVSIGDTRVDRVIDVAGKLFSHEAIEAFSHNSKVLVVGSNWPSDDVYLLPLLKKRKDIKAIVAPHELHDAQYEKWRGAFKEELQTVAEIDDGVRDGTRIIYVNKIGLLANLYCFADVAYVGGGFGKAVHNTLEAAVYGIPVIFGPKNRRFQEIAELQNLGAGIEIRDQSTLEESLDKAMEDSNYREQTKTKLNAFFASQRGASQKVVDWLEAETQ